MSTKIAVKKFVDMLGGQAATAKLLGVSQPTVHYWVKVGRVPGDKVIQIENGVNGAVTRHELRPDIFGPRPDESRPDAA